MFARGRGSGRGSGRPAGGLVVAGRVEGELAEQFASHIEVNAIVYCDGDEIARKKIEEQAANNIKRVIARVGKTWSAGSDQSPYFIADTQEIKTTWHPIGS